MKKTFAFIMALILCFGVLSVVSVSADDFTPVLRYAVFSDIHIDIENDYRCEKVTNAIKYAYELAKADSSYDKLDAVVIAGDIGNAGEEHQWQSAKDVILANTDTEETALMVLMGNHEFYEEEEHAVERFTKMFKDVNGGGHAEILPETLDCVNMHFVLNGYHFIGFSPDVSLPWEFAYSDEKVAWVEKQLEIAEADTGKDKPIFVFQHIGTADTVIGTETETSAQFKDIYSKYPQLVSFSGHSHFPLNAEASVWQGGFTAFGTGAFKYAAMPYFNDVKVYLVDKDEYDIDQFYMVEIDAAGRARITMQDTDTKSQIGETYMLDSYKVEDFKYLPERLADIPFKFPENANLEVTNVMPHKINFNFTPVGQDGLTATAYHVTIEDPDGKQVFEQYVGWAFYDENEDDMPVEFGGIIPGLKEGILYTLNVEGINTGYKEEIDEEAYVTENKLTTTFHLGELPEESEISEQSESVVEPAEEKTDLTPIIIGIAAAVVVAIAIVVVVIVVRNKKKNK